LLTDKDQETEVFNVFLYSRMIGASAKIDVTLRPTRLCFTLCGTWAMLLRGRETASGRMEKSAVLSPVPKQKVSIVEREGPGWTV
jgi:hypothetical protein